jgi:hypothetical protein
VTLEATKLREIKIEEKSDLIHKSAGVANNKKICMNHMMKQPPSLE